MSRLSVLSLLATCTLLGCRVPPDTNVAIADGEARSSTAATVDEPPTSAALVLQFGWRPGRMSVIEQVHKKGRDATLQYVLDIIERDGGLEINYREMHFTAMEGMDLADPVVRADITKLERSLATGLPAFQINSAGEFVGLDTEALVAIHEQFESHEYTFSVLDD